MAFFDHPTPSSTLSPSPSLELDDLLAYTEVKVSCLLSESFDQDILSIPSSGIPSFPSECIAPLITVVGLLNNLPMFPRGLPSVGGICTTNAMAKPTLTVPTAPRLRTMSKESLCVKKWAECLVGTDAPGHIPWGDLGEPPSSTWVPEGSCYPPEAFKEALLGMRREMKAQKPLVVASTHSEEIPPASQPLYYCPSPTPFCEGLVFEREIAFGSANKRRRWSLQVPATDMNPEMVDMMLELRDLNAFFKGGMHDLDHSETLSNERKVNHLPPSLVVSDSCYTFPISLESSGNLTSEVPLTLAARRGKMPAALSTRKGPCEFEYPDIPTAFLGSPSAYSPKFEFANRSDGPSMDLEEMVATLRAAVPGRSPCMTEAFETELAERNAELSTAPMEEEWAFADDLLKNYRDPMHFPDNSITALKGRQSICLPSGKGLLPQSLGDVEVIPSDSVPDMSHDTSDISIKGNHWDDTGRPHSEQSPRILGPTPVFVTRPPSTPLPPRPALIGPSSPKRVIGILKSCKSVRFASLPSRRAVPSNVPKPLSTERRDHLKTPSIASLRRPSPLRNSYAPSLVSNSPSTVDTPIPARVAHPASSTVPRAAGRKGSRSEDATGRSASTTKPSSTLKPTLATKRPPISSPLASSNSSAKQGIIPTKKLVSSLGRHSLGGLGGGIMASGAENRIRAASSSDAPSRWSTLNENMRRRGSETSSRDSSAQKSRIRAPLRNIFTRFK